jgi:hypothetical protein
VLIQVCITTLKIRYNTKTPGVGRCRIFLAYNLVRRLMPFRCGVLYRHTGPSNTPAQDLSIGLLTSELAWLLSISWVTAGMSCARKRKRGHSTFSEVCRAAVHSPPGVTISICLPKKGAGPLRKTKTPSRAVLRPRRRQNGWCAIDYCRWWARDSAYPGSIVLLPRGI